MTCHGTRCSILWVLLYSDLPWYKVFYRALDKISDLLLNHQIEVVEPFLKGLFTHPLPNTGVDTILSVVPHEVDTGQVYSFPLPNPKRLAEIPTDVSSVQYYNYVCIKKGYKTNRSSFCVATQTFAAYAHIILVNKQLHILQSVH